MVQWIISVVKRVVRGVPIAQAAMENIGYLLMSVAVAAFMPAAVAYTVDFIDAAAWAILGDYIAEVIATGMTIFGTLAAITIMTNGAGGFITMPITLMILLAIFGLWIMLVVREALILLGLVFGPLVFSGLVDKDLWGHTRKWVGIMGGIIASKLGIFLALALAGALLDGVVDGRSMSNLPLAIGTCITFLALLFIALFMPFQVAKWLPIVGDEMQAMSQIKDEAAQRAKSVKVQRDDMKARAASKNAASGRDGGAIGTASKAAPPIAAGMAVKEGIDQARDQTVQAAKDGADTASGNGGGEQGSGSGKDKSPGGTGGSPLGRGRGSSGGRGGSVPAGARRPAPTPPPRSGAPESRPGSAPPLRRQGGQPPQPPPLAPPPQPPAN
ncbi:hypothetical protein ACIQGT_36685 [Streptomyces sp. NPDC093108]|uniref:hypothetical protein n=1 Tax=Streptomyces sp. NPDC093108 TaxID=3366030 RepID=UPI0037F8C1CC